LNFELPCPVTKTTRLASTPRRLNPLKVSDGFRAFVLDQLEELGEVTPKAMFGGVGLYHNGLFFGILAGDVLYLKADDSTRATFERADAKPFKPYPDRAGTMQYYSVPIGVLESGLELARWARRAIAAASRAASQSRTARVPDRPRSARRTRSKTL
jgi:DNA transformation protein and related proteins